MDLTSFTQAKKKNIIENIVKSDNLIIDKIGNEVVFNIKSKKALEDNQDFLFFSPTDSIITESKEEAQAFFEKSIAEGVEGLMVKSLNHQYKPGIRTGSMAKLKETKEDLDVVIVAAEYGKGKRAGFFSSFYVALKGGMEDELFEVGKVSSGIKELGSEGASLENLSKLLLKYKLREKSNVVYFEPKIIIQVKYQEIQKSTTYSSGYALRFPRIVSLRDDKVVEEINSIEDIERMVE